jgi:hypothetical protein
MAWAKRFREEGCVTANQEESSFNKLEQSPLNDETRAAEIVTSVQQKLNTIPRAGMAAMWAVRILQRNAA